jgi:hypothetical protein
LAARRIRLDFQREKAQPESVYEHCETHNDVLCRIGSLPHKGGKCMLATVSGELYVALDVHKQYVVVGAVNAHQQVALAPRRVDLDDFFFWSQQHLRSTDAVVLEATTNAWHLCDQLGPQVASVTVAHPILVKLITSARVKTDARDTLHLARPPFGGAHSCGVDPSAGRSRVAGAGRAPHALDRKDPMLLVRHFHGVLMSLQGPALFSPLLPASPAEGGGPGLG